MAIGWFICGYTVNPNRPNMRFCSMDQFTPQISADSGTWSESEVLGGNAVVKVRALDATLTTIAGTNGFFRIPANFVNLIDSLSGLTAAQRNAINNRLLAMGYTQAEIDAVLGSTLATWRTHTLGDILRFAAQRRLKPRWDDVQLQIVLDGPTVACKPISEIDSEVAP